MVHFGFPVTVSMACNAPSDVPISTRLSALTDAVATEDDDAGDDGVDWDVDATDDEDNAVSSCTSSRRTRS